MTKCVSRKKPGKPTKSISTFLKLSVGGKDQRKISVFLPFLWKALEHGGPRPPAD